MKYDKINYMGTPSFIIIGAMKSGTTALYSTICQHSQIQKAKKKETNYFWNGYHKSIEKYQSMFPDGITGEASPSYMVNKVCAERIHRWYPRTKIIAILRNPVERAWSHYNMALRQKWETLGFEAACKAEVVRLKNADPFDWDYMRYSYTLQGQYSQALKPFFLLFEDILVIQSEKFLKERQKMMARIFSFLDLPVEDTVQRGKQTAYPALDTRSKIALEYYYEPYNEFLYKLIGERFDW